MIAALVQSKLDMLHTELIYIDEFSVNERNSNNYGWWEKGKQGYVDYLMDNFSMTFIWAFSEQRFYGIMGNKESNNSASLIQFLIKIFECRSKIITIENLNPFTVWDNASLHKSRELLKIYKDSGISVLTIPPYEPALNPAEKLILAIKTKIKIYQNEGNVGFANYDK